MKFINFEQSGKFENSKQCTVWEYDFGDKDINNAVAKIDGRYPDSGYCLNEECKELVYVVQGSGVLYIKDGDSFSFKEKDSFLIDKGEAYYWEGNCTVLMPCTPAWNVKQHKFVD